MLEEIRQEVCKEYENTLGIVVYKLGQRVLEEYFSGADRADWWKVFILTKK